MEDIIVKYLKNEASNEEKLLLLNWLKEDENNRKLLSELQAIWQASASRADTAKATETAFNRFLDQSGLAEERDKDRFRIRSVPRRWIAAAAVIVFLLTTGSFLIGRSGSTPRHMYTVVMDKKSKGSILLPDSTVVWLNAGSRLTYPELFDDKKREVTLEGEGYFNVVRNQKAPFIVKTSAMKIKVLGTRFDVKCQSGNPVVKTTLLSGSVEVELLETKQHKRLSPNQQLAYNTKERAVFIDEINANEQILWINDQLELSNAKLSEVLRKLGYWYDLEFIIEENVDMQQRLSFVVRNESKEELLNILAQITPIRYTLDGNKVYVSSN